MHVGVSKEYDLVFWRRTGGVGTLLLYRVDSDRSVVESKLFAASATAGIVRSYAACTFVAEAGAKAVGEADEGVSRML